MENFLKKLKREWKTFAWGVLGTSLELWDTVMAGQMALVEPFVPQQYQWIIHAAIPIGFLLLRKWKDTHVVVEPTQSS